MNLVSANNIIRIPCSLGMFFRYWVIFLRPFHRLKNKEMDILVSFIRYRYEYGKVIKDEDILDSVIMNKDTKKKIREENGVSQAYFQVIMSKLRKNDVIVDGRINPKFIPNISNEDNFKLLFLFDVNDG